MKVCSNCEKENPSAANYCMFCNTQLVDIDQLSEEDKLRKKLAEAKSQIELLKQNKELEELIKQKKKEEKHQHDFPILNKSGECEKLNNYESQKVIKPKNTILETKKKSIFIYYVSPILLILVLLFFFFRKYDKSEKQEHSNILHEQQVEIQKNKNIKKTEEKQTQTYDNQTIPGKYPQASDRLLTTNDIQRMSKEDLQIMRNEIYARYGYIFKLEKYKNYFNNQSWYTPKSTDVSLQLSSIEQKNVEFIKQHE